MLMRILLFTLGALGLADTLLVSFISNMNLKYKWFFHFFANFKGIIPIRR